MKTEIVLATNIFGRLEPTLRQRIKAALDNPATCWKDARNIIIDCKSMTTLWRAVCAIEPSMNNSHAVPSRETIERGLRFATH